MSVVLPFQRGAHCKPARLSRSWHAPILSQDSMVDSLLTFAMEHKDRVRMELIKPAVDWRARAPAAAGAAGK